MREDRRLPARSRSFASAKAGEQGVGATPETLAKLRTDPVRQLARQGKLSPEAEQAAYEIREAFAIVSGPVALRVSDPAAAPRERTSLRLPFESETERRLALRRRYLRWRRALAARGLPAWPVLDVVIDELTCREAETRRGVRHGRARDGLIAALELYCVLRGWAGEALARPEASRTEFTGSVK